MKLLDTRGYVYDVYDMGDGRVLKKEKPMRLQYAQHAVHGNTPGYVRTHKRRGRKLADGIADPDLIGNPIFPDSKSYTQDKVTILEHYIESHALEENKKIIDAYIESIFDTWKNGFSDIIFNFSHNNGVAPSGRVILIDFNEVTFDKNVVLERFAIKRWLKAASYTKWLQEGDLKRYYAEAMENAMTPANLDRYWHDNAKLLAKNSD